MLKKLSMLLCFILLFPIIAAGQYQVGDEVDNFSLTDTEGSTVSLTGLQGKVVLLNFFESW